MYQELRLMLILKYGKVYLFLCLCFNKQKLEKVQKTSLIQQENEFMREEYLKILKRLKRIYTHGEIVLNALDLEKLNIYLNTEKIKELLGQNGRMDSADQRTLDKKINIIKSQKTVWQNDKIKQNGNDLFKTKSFRKQKDMDQTYDNTYNNIRQSSQDSREEIKMEKKQTLGKSRFYSKVSPSFSAQRDQEQNMDTEQPEDQIASEDFKFNNGLGNQSIQNLDLKESGRETKNQEFLTPSRFSELQSPDLQQLMNGIQPQISIRKKHIDKDKIKPTIQPKKGYTRMRQASNVKKPNNDMSLEQIQIDDDQNPITPKDDLTQNLFKSKDFKNKLWNDNKSFQLNTVENNANENLEESNLYPLHSGRGLQESRVLEIGMIEQMLEEVENINQLNEQDEAWAQQYESSRQLIVNNFGNQINDKEKNDILDQIKELDNDSFESF